MKILFCLFCFCFDLKSLTVISLYTKFSFLFLSSRWKWIKALKIVLQLLGWKLFLKVFSFPHILRAKWGNKMNKLKFKWNKIYLSVTENYLFYRKLTVATIRNSHFVAGMRLGEGTILWKSQKLSFILGLQLIITSFRFLSNINFKLWEQSVSSFVFARLFCFSISTQIKRKQVLRHFWDINVRFIIYCTENLRKKCSPTDIEHNQKFFSWSFFQLCSQEIMIQN